MSSRPHDGPARTLLRDAMRLGGVFAASLLLGGGVSLGLPLIGGEAALGGILAAFAGLIAWRSAPGSPLLTGMLIFAGNAIACGFVLGAGVAACRIERSLRTRHRLVDRVLRRSYARASVLTALVPTLERLDPSLPRTGLAISVLVPSLSMVINGLASGLVIGALIGAGTATAMAPVATYGPLEVISLAVCGALAPRLCEWGQPMHAPVASGPLLIGTGAALALAATIETAFLSSGR